MERNQNESTNKEKLLNQEEQNKQLNQEELQLNQNLLTEVKNKYKNLKNLLSKTDINLNNKEIKEAFNNLSSSYMKYDSLESENDEIQKEIKNCSDLISSFVKNPESGEIKPAMHSFIKSFIYDYYVIPVIKELDNHNFQESLNIKGIGKEISDEFYAKLNQFNLYTEEEISNGRSTLIKGMFFNLLLTQDLLSAANLNNTQSFLKEKTDNIFYNPLIIQYLSNNNSFKPI
ncbi:MAG: hypothetical protein N4A49_07900 [Marinifilaceae bacterium]|jgi:hypothetical protein|nr:hypothetical protein [Marinifilaceae bacterium]